MTKKFYRSTKYKMFGGVCGGIAEYFGISPAIVRIIFIILALPGGFPGILPYLVLWVVIPEKPSTTNG